MPRSSARLLSLFALFAAGLLAPTAALAWVSARITIPAATFGGGLSPVETNCKDGIDNDGDGFADRLDSDCSSGGVAGSAPITIEGLGGSSDPGGDGIMPVPFWLVTLSTGQRELYAFDSLDARGDATYLPFMSGVERVSGGPLVADWIDADADGRVDFVLGASDAGKYGALLVYLSGARTYDARRYDARFTGDADRADIVAGLARDGDTLLVDLGHLGDAGPGYLMYNYLGVEALRSGSLAKSWAVFKPSTGVVSYR